MTFLSRHTALLAALAIALWVDGGQLAVAQSDCRSVAATPTGIQAFSSVRRAIVGDVVRAQLCQEEGRWVYRVTVISTSGAVKTILLDARTGTTLSE